MFEVADFSQERRERKEANRAISEGLMMQRRMYRMLLDDIARSNNEHERRAFAKMLGKLCHDHGYRSGGGA